MNRFILLLTLSCTFMVSAWPDVANAAASPRHEEALGNGAHCEEGQSLLEESMSKASVEEAEEWFAERDRLGALDFKEPTAIVPCAFAESGRFGSTCPDAALYVMTDSGVVLCRVPVTQLKVETAPTHLRQDKPLAAFSHFESHNSLGQANFEQDLAEHFYLAVLKAESPSLFWQDLLLPISALAHPPAVPPA